MPRTAVDPWPQATIMQITPELRMSRLRASAFVRLTAHDDDVEAIHVCTEPLRAHPVVVARRRIWCNERHRIEKPELTC